MFDYDKLNGIIVEKCGTKRSFSKKMNLSETSIYKKLSGQIEFKPMMSL